ncbi:MAG: hypothetical protein IJ637_01225 [Prevotella sp.]|nr:hypothetical protein [Prevotella sp.]
MKKKLTKKRFMTGFVCIVIILFIVRIIFPTITASVQSGLTVGDSDFSQSAVRPHRIMGVANYKTVFPDSQSVQIVAAAKWGVRPVDNRTDAEERKKELVYVGESPYYHVDRLNSSIPYLVPRAAALLQDIGMSFYDSLYAKGVPLNQLIVTSVLRSMDDVKKLQRHNGNATDNSCHLYGTTFDICYNRYTPVEREVRNDTLKWILSEVLRDKRQEGRCYIKYEVKQGCFHMTVR